MDALTKEEILLLKDEEALKEQLRTLRDGECFSVINRGKLWYDTLTEEEYQELSQWYLDWLMVTETLVIPDIPTWIE